MSTSNEEVKLQRNSRTIRVIRNSWNDRASKGNTISARKANKLIKYAHIDMLETGAFEIKMERGQTIDGTEYYFLLGTDKIGAHHLIKIIEDNDV